MDFRNNIKDLVDEIAKQAGPKMVFGESRTIGDRVVIPVAQVAYGGGGGFGREAAEEGAAEGAEEAGVGIGFGIQAKPMGTIVVTAEDVRWVPTFDVTRIVALGCMVAVAAMLTMRSMASG